MQKTANRLVAFNAAGRRIGESHPRAKLTDDDVTLVFELREAGLSYQQIADKFDDDVSISKAQVRNILLFRQRAQPTHLLKRPTALAAKKVARGCT